MCKRLAFATAEEEAADPLMYIYIYVYVYIHAVFVRVSHANGAYCEFLLTLQIIFHVCVSRMQFREKRCRSARCAPTTPR